MKLKYYFHVNWFKTFYINYVSLNLFDALKIPIIVFYKTKIKSLKGKIQINSSIKHSMIKLGRCDVNGWEKQTTTINVDGILIFNGKATIGRGSLLDIKNTGCLELGNRFRITAGTSIICEKSISIGDEFLSSWDNLIMDSDHHKIFDNENVLINPPTPIIIGNHVWIGCRNTLLKGCSIPNNSVVASGSVLTKKFSEESTIIGGIGKNSQILKQNILWKE